MIRKVVFALSFSCFTVLCYGAADTVTVHKDARLDALSSHQAAVNKLTSKLTSNGQYRGFRLQVITTRSRDEAFKTKSDMMQMFPQQKAYVIYQSPNFKVRIGNFIQKSDALAFRAELAKKYPPNAYVVEDIVEYTPADDEDPVAN